MFFAVVVLPDQARYAAATFLVFLGAAWWALAPPGGLDEASTAAAMLRSTPPSRRLHQLVIIVVVAAQVVALLAVYPSKTADRFAPNAVVADVVRAAGLERHVVSGQDLDATSVAAYLDQPVYSVARHEWIQYFVHDDREARRFDTVRIAEVLCTARRLAGDARHATAVITEAPLPRLGPGVARIATIDHVEVVRVTPEPRRPAAPTPRRPPTRACPDHRGRPAESARLLPSVRRFDPEPRTALTMRAHGGPSGAAPLRHPSSGDLIDA